MNYDDHFRRLAHSACDELEEFRSHGETSLAARLDKFCEGAEGLEGDANQEFFDLRYDDLAQLRDTLPQVLRSSTVLMAFSIAEHYLDRYCGHIRSFKKLPLALNEVNGKGLERAKLYLKKVALLRTFPDNGSAWQYIIDMRAVRNRIVHGGGRVARGKRDEQLRATVARLPGVSINNDSIELDANCAHRLITEIGSFFDALLK